jgi:Zn finger protein HypA/HybF involved in hydrogenase expression
MGAKLYIPVSSMCVECLCNVEVIQKPYEVVVKIVCPKCKKETVISREDLQVLVHAYEMQK